jgi:hypothetical protein
MGLGPGWSAAPPCGQGEKIWGINNVCNWRDVDYVFEIHDYNNKLFRLRGGLNHQKAIRKAIRKKIPYIVREHWNFLPGLKQVVYPWEAVFQHFQTDFLGCSMDCMIAMAIYCGYKELQVYGLGINLASHYDYQIPSMNYWLGYCNGAGIKVRINNVDGWRHTDVLRTVDGEVYGLRKPQRAWPTHDPSLKPCDCTKSHNAAHCAF